MTTPSPPWLQNFKPDTSEPANKWQPGMKSPNPKGRPPGISDRRTKIAQAFLDDAQDIAKAVIAKALQGDLQAAALVLSRVLPVLKARAEKVTFTLDTTASLTDQSKSILASISVGDVDPEVGKMLIYAIASVAGLAAVDELKQRLDALEQRAASSSVGIAKGGVLCVG